MGAQLHFAAPASGLLRRLDERMGDFGISADARVVAAVILDVARDMDWAQHPQGVVDWLSQLVLEMAQTSPAVQADAATIREL